MIVLRTKRKIYTFLSCSFFCLKYSRTTMSYRGAKYSLFPSFMSFIILLTHNKHSIPQYLMIFIPRFPGVKWIPMQTQLPLKSHLLCDVVLTSFGAHSPVLDKPDWGAEVSNEFPNEGEALKTQQFPWQGQQQDPKAPNNTFHALSWVVGHSKDRDVMSCLGC